MPRLSTSLIIQAYRQDPLLPCLLKECRSLDSARNELRWLRDKAIQIPGNANHKTTIASNWRHRLRVMCSQRARGKPLQYIIGDQPFGDLEILCRKGVLIPRSVLRKPWQSCTEVNVTPQLGSKRNYTHFILPA